MIPTLIPDLQSSILCDDVRQERNGKFMLIGIFDAIAVPRYPAVFQRLCMVNRWCCGLGTFKQQTRLLCPDETTVLTAAKPVDVRLQDNTGTATCIEFFMNVRFEQPGTYWIEVLLDDALKLRYPLKAGLLKPRDETPADPAP